jgi:hypothetical protein
MGFSMKNLTDDLIDEYNNKNHNKLYVNSENKMDEMNFDIRKKNKIIEIYSKRIMPLIHFCLLWLLGVLYSLTIEFNIFIARLFLLMVIAAFIYFLKVFYFDIRKLENLRYNNQSFVDEEQHKNSVG